VRVIPHDSGLIKTVVGVCGSGASPGAGDGGPATSSKLWVPQGLAIDSKRGVLFVADTNNHRIRMVLYGIITTVAGSVAGYSGDGGTSVICQCFVSVSIFIELSIFDMDRAGHCCTTNNTYGYLVP
jgi:NHL repeat